ncbi:MAG: GatB/YqeY domain-containing protein [Gammaproteobacteria bacterium]|nr:GatB/YqeY domain-containing protein [Gammaproteobacteria bacterium]MDH5799675.1 GatB/YqeY domain-containing protein [Gammaproteobacteria bacterium]
MSTLKQQLTDDMKAAMKAKEKQRLGVLRLALAALKQVEVDERKELTDTDVLAVLDKMIKQRRDSISQYEAANRQDLADQEKYEVDVLQGYLPAAMDENELEAVIKEIIAATGAASMQDMGKVMNELRPKVQGRADMGMVSQKVKSLLSGA